MTAAPPPEPGTPSALDLAAQQLRLREEPRAVEIADAVLRRSLLAPRPAVLVRARPPHEYLQVSSTAIVAVVRERLDARLVGAAVGRVLLDVTRDGALDSLTIELLVRYGSDILALADEARVLSRTAVAGLLGPEPADAEVPVVVDHVHVSDVTIGDPHLVDPADE